MQQTPLKSFRLVRGIATMILLSAMCVSANSLDVSQSTDEIALRKFVENYFRLLANRDLERLQQLWNAQSADWSSRKAELERMFASYDQITVTAPDVTRVDVNGEHAEVLATIQINGVDGKTKKPVEAIERGVRKLSLVKEEGSWMLVRDISAEQDFSDRLLVASAEERERMLSAEKELATPALVRSLHRGSGALKRKGEYPKALEVLELALRIADQTADKAAQALVLNSIADVRIFEGNIKLAQELFQKALALGEAAGDKERVIDSLIGIGIAQRARGEGDQGIEVTKRALAMSEEMQLKLKVVWALNNLGIIQREQGNLSEALEYLGRSQSICEELNEKGWLAATLNVIGRIYTLRGETELAIETLTKSLALFQETQDRPQVANLLNNIGIIHSMRGDYGSAMKYFQNGLTEYQAVGDRSGISNGFNNLGIVYRRLNNLNLALEYQKKGLALIEGSDDKAGIARSLNNIGMVYKELRDTNQALEYFHRALEINESLKNRVEIANVLNNIGSTYRSLGNYVQSIEMFNRALKLREELKDKWGAAIAHIGIARGYFLQRDFQHTIEAADRAAVLAREAGLRDELSMALTASGKANRAMGRVPQAREAFTQAIAVVEEMRNIAGAQQAQRRVFEDRLDAHYEMIALLVSEGDAKSALELAELCKARELLDVLQGGRINITKAMSAVERDTEQRLKNELASLNGQTTRENRLPHPDPAKLAQLNARLEKTRLEQEDFQTRLYASHPELKVHRGEAPHFKLDDATGLLPDSKTVLLEFVVTDEATLLFAITKSVNKTNPEIAAYTIPIKRQEVIKLAQEFREKLGSRDLAFREPAQKLYSLLLRPAQAQLEGKSHMIIVADDQLWELAFQALQPSANHYLIEQTAVSYVPSLTVLREMVAQRSKRLAAGTRSSTLFALGNPELANDTIERAKITKRGQGLAPLPEAEKEVEALAKVYGANESRVLIGAAAREDTFKSQANKFKVLHIATHGVLNNSSPMYSHLLFSAGDSKEDGLLETWELMNLDLNADLVVLSACETGRGQYSAGEGIIGLTWAFFVAGSPTTVASQWKVDSASTTQLMIEFHKNLKSRRPGATTAGSLQRSALQLMKNPEYGHPFYWAGFVVLGDAF